MIRNVQAHFTWLAPFRTQLFADAEAAEITEIFTTQNVAMISYALDAVNNNLTATTYSETLLVAGFQFVAHAQSLAVTPLAAITWLNTDLAFVAGNADPSSNMYVVYNDRCVRCSLGVSVPLSMSYHFHLHFRHLAAS